MEIGDFIHPTDLDTDHITQAVKAQQERLEYELRGAYRAGYNYYYLGRDLSAATGFKTYGWPTYTETKPKDLVENADRYKWVRYKLHELDPREYRELIHG